MNNNSNNNGKDRTKEEREDEEEQSRACEGRCIEGGRRSEGIKGNEGRRTKGRRTEGRQTKGNNNMDMVYVVATDVEMKPMSPSNMVSNPMVRKEAARLGALRITDESHDLIMDEIERRERLECDPSRVFMDEEEDSDSEGEDEWLVEILESI